MGEYNMCIGLECTKQERVSKQEDCKLICGCEKNVSIDQKCEH